MGRVIVIGVSPNPARYSYQCVEALVHANYEVIAIGIRAGYIGKIKICTDRPLLKDIDTIILYVNKEVQQNYLDYVLQLNPAKILFNPGTECPEMAQVAIDNGIAIKYDCALVLINSERI